jgi:predicted RNase H-like HicB family nuclease
MFRIILTPEPDGGFTVTVPSLPGCVTWGETLEGAKAMAREAIGLYLEDLAEGGEDLPDDNNSLELSLIVA